MTHPASRRALRFVLLVGVMSFFADFTYEGARAIVFGQQTLPETRSVAARPQGTTGAAARTRDRTAQRITTRPGSGQMAFTKGADGASRVSMRRIPG
jgi:hypothetical protein